jgi:N-acylneuraminate cytidylyltransferase
MKPDRNILALIPARGGSKSIPRKNIRDLGGYPLIAYSIAAALQSDLVQRVVVSTDNAEIAEIARDYGAENPFMRPSDLARDETLDLPVFQHALQWFAENEDYHPDIVIQLRPTSPFRPIACVDEAVEILLRNPHADSVRGIVPSGQNPFKMWRISETGQMKPLIESEFDEPYNMPRQKLPATFWQTGHIDVIRREVIQKGSMSGDVIFPMLIDPRYSIDLDTLLDWEWAEWRLKNPKLQIVRPAKAHRHRPIPDTVELLILDFDGVMTDNRVYLNQDGIEMVAANRGDGMGIELLLKNGTKVMILSTEKNPVVSARAQKLKIPVIQGVGNKGEVLHNLLLERGINSQNTVYLGNDVNDLPCFPIVGCAVAVADSHPKVIAQADFVLSKKGGDGAVRELCDILLERSAK